MTLDDLLALGARFALVVLAAAFLVWVVFTSMRSLKVLADNLATGLA
jgi:hypothetical protein